MNGAKVQVDAARCTGCGVCLTACPEGVILLLEGRAQVDEAACTGCGACLTACPEEAIRPVAGGELATRPARPAPTLYRPSPLAETAGAAIAVASAGLLLRVVRSLLQALGRWLMRRIETGEGPDSAAPVETEGQGRGRRTRVRRRGR